MSVGKPQLRTGGFCWSKMLLPTCPRWWRPAHLNWNKHEKFHLSGVICTILFSYFLTLLLLLLHSFNGLFSSTTRVSWHHKGKPFWILMKREMMGGSGISWTICKPFAPCCRQITTPVPHHSVFLQAGCPSVKTRKHNFSSFLLHLQSCSFSHYGMSYTCN